MTRNNKKANAHILRAAELMCNLSLGNNREGFGMENVQEPGPDQAPVVQDQAGVQDPGRAQRIVSDVVKFHDAVLEGAVKGTYDAVRGWVLPFAEVTAAVGDATERAFIAAQTAGQNAIDNASEAISGLELAQQNIILGTCSVCTKSVYKWEYNVICDAFAIGGCLPNSTAYHRECFLKWSFHARNEDGDYPNLNRCARCNHAPCIPFNEFFALNWHNLASEERHLYDLATQTAKARILRESARQRPRQMFQTVQEIHKRLENVGTIASAFIGGDEGSNLSLMEISSSMAGETIRFNDCDFRATMEKCKFSYTRFNRCKFHFIGNITRSKPHARLLDGSRVNSFAGSTFLRVNFHRCDFITAEFTDSSFTKCSFTECNFHNDCSFQKTKFKDCTFKDVQVQVANLRGCVMYKTTLDDCDFLSVAWQEAKIEKSLMNQCRFRPIEVVDRKQVTVTDQCSLQSSKFLRTKITDCIFHNIKLDESIFELCTIKFVQFLHSTLTDVIFSNTPIGQCILSTVQQNDIQVRTTRGGDVERTAHRIYQVATTSDLGPGWEFDADEVPSLPAPPFA